MEKQVFGDEKAVRDAEARTKAVLDAVCEGIFTLNEQAVIESLNPAGAKIFGYEPEELIGQNAFMFLAEPFRAEYNKLLKEFTDGGSAKTLGVVREILGVRKDGSLVPVEIVLSELRLSGERLFTGIVRDISQRKIAEERLRRSEEKLRSTIESMDDLVFNLDRDGRFLDCNRPSLLNQLLLQPGAFVNRHYREAMPADFVELLDKAIEEVGKQDGVQKFDHSVEIGGKTAWYSVAVSARKDDQDHYDGATLVARDITERKLAEEELRYRADYENLLISLSLGLINPSGDDIDKYIEKTLEIAGEFAGVDRGYVFFKSPDGKIISNTHDWCAAGAESNRKDFPAILLEEFPWVNSQLESAKIIHIPDADALGKEAEAEKRLLEALGIKSVLAVPIESRGRVIGLLGFSTVAEAKKWPQDFIYLLRMMGELFVSAWERNRAERELRNQKALLDSLIDSIPDLIFYKETGGIYLGCNQSFAEYVGRDVGEIIGRTDGEFFSRNVAEFFRENDRIMLADGKPRRNEEWITYPDGRSVLLETLKTPYFGPEGQTLGLVGISRDITERKLIEDRLRHSEENLTTVLNSTDDSVALVDRDGRLLALNESMAKRFNKTVEELLGTDFYRLFDVGDAQRRRAMTERTFKNGKLVRFEDKREGSIIDQTLYPVFNPNGDVTRVAIFARDITGQVRIREELQRARDTAEEANRMKSEFLAMMSHEIRTPMNVIVGTADLLRETSLSEEQKHYVQLYSRAGENLLELIDDILDFSKVEAGRLHLERVTFDPVEVTARTVEMLAIRAQEKGLELVLRTDLEAPVATLGDPRRLRQILINLIGNAVKFTERGEVVVGVKALGYKQLPLAAEKGIELEFSVSDTGIGIPINKLSSVFNSFEQADSSTTRRYGGTGLGLAISKRLVEMMGGEIEIESEAGHGSTFRFSLVLPVVDGVVKNRTAPDLESERPLLFESKDSSRAAAKELLHRFNIDVTAVADGADEVIPAVKPSEAGESLPAKRKLRILLADDALENQLLIRAFLKTQPYEIDVADDGESALSAFKEGNYDLVLMDIAMPRMDGYTATAEIRRWESETGLEPTPIVALSAHARAEDSAKSLDVGCNAHVNKPVRKAEIIGVIERLAGKKKEKMEL